MSLWQLSAAQAGELQKFYQVIEASEKTLPTEYANLRGRADAVEAYILVKNNQIEKARQLAGKWTETDKLDANARYWKRFPTGEEIVKCWKQLLGRN